MSLSAAAIRMLADKGLTLDEIAAVAEANECDKPVSKGALRMRRLRERRASEASPERHMASHSVTPEPSAKRHESVTTRHIASPLRARVEDNPLRLEISGKLSLSLVRERAGDALASEAKSPGIASIAPLTSLLAGPEPCLPDEVYDGIAKAAAWYRAKRPPGSMGNWDLARRMALELRDQRLAGTPEPKAPHERPDRNSPPRFADAGRQRADANFAGGALALSRRRAGRDPQPSGDFEGGPSSPARLLAGG